MDPLVFLINDWIFLATMNFAHFNHRKYNQHLSPVTALSLLLQTLYILIYEDDMACLSYLHNYKNRKLANVWETSFLSNNEFIIHFTDMGLSIEPVCTRCSPAGLEAGKNQTSFLSLLLPQIILLWGPHRENLEVSC